VDHEQRRQEIIQALWRIAMTEGVAAATFRRVAAEAGVSVNLVQYYFTSKDQLLHYGLQRVTEVAVERMRNEMAEFTGSGPRAVLRACLLGMLPVDETAKLTSTIYIAYLSYAVHDPEIKALVQTTAKSLATQLVPLAEQAQDADTDPLAETASLVAMVAGLASQILIEAYTPEEAIALVDYRLDRLFAVRTV
jgi:TetR/AcrR family transcriptional regulator, transcriptional repressor of bet genes